MTYLVIAEDKARLARALASDLQCYPDQFVMECYPNGKDLLAGLPGLTHLPDIVLMDVEMPVLDGIEATRQLKSRYPQVRVVMTTVFEEEEVLFAAIRAGADGYLLKGGTPEEYRRAIAEVMHGGAPMTPCIARKSLRLLRSGSAPADSGKGESNPLSPRETEVLEQLSAGLKYREVGENLHLSEGTVRKHVENIYRKLRVTNKVAAVRRGRQAGWF